MSRCTPQPPSPRLAAPSPRRGLLQPEFVTGDPGQKFKSCAGCPPPAPSEIQPFTLQKSAKTPLSLGQSSIRASVGNPEFRATSLAPDVENPSCFQTFPPPTRAPRRANRKKFEPHPLQVPPRTGIPAQPAAHCAGAKPHRTRQVTLRTRPRSSSFDDFGLARLVVNDAGRRRRRRQPLRCRRSPKTAEFLSAALGGARWTRRGARRDSGDLTG